MILILLIFALLCPVKNAAAQATNDSGRKANFSDVPGIDAETDAIDYREGNEAPKPKKTTEEKQAGAEGEKTLVPDSGVKGSFSDVPGMETEVAPIDYRTGDEDKFHRKLNGIKKEKDDKRVALREKPDSFGDEFAQNDARVNARDIQGEDAFHDRGPSPDQIGRAHV